MKFFTKIVKKFKLHFTTFKRYILYIWQGSECLSGHWYIITALINPFKGLKIAFPFVYFITFQNLIDKAIEQYYLLLSSMY